MKTWVAFTVLTVMSAVMLTGCFEGPKATIKQNDGYTLIVQEDCAHNVVCYRFRGFEGMSCVKLEGEARSCPNQK